MKAIGNLEAELKHSSPCRLSISGPLFAVQKGQDWNEIKDSIKGWLLSSLATIAPGVCAVDVPGVPFQISEAERRRLRKVQEEVLTPTARSGERRTGSGMKV